MYILGSNGNLLSQYKSLSNFLSMLNERENTYILYIDTIHLMGYRVSFVF